MILVVSLFLDGASIIDTPKIVALSVQKYSLIECLV
jgi:hypothetical protein